MCLTPEFLRDKLSKVFLDMKIRERDMAKSAKSAAHKSKYQPEQDENAGKQLNDLISFFHSDVLHSFISHEIPVGSPVPLPFFGRNKAPDIFDRRFGSEDHAK